MKSKVIILVILCLTSLSVQGQGIIKHSKTQSSLPKITAFYQNGILHVGSVSYAMVYVEGGTFMMGATREQVDDAFNDEEPAHEVTLSNFNIGETEVTQELWTAVMGSNPSDFKGENLPVDNVSWEDCQEFILKLNQLTGLHFRLPTEAEWEYASRGGRKSQGYKYSGSNHLEDVAWCANNSDSSTHSVKGKLPNEIGLYDMSGNVYEWCNDWYGSYPDTPQTNPQGPYSDSICVLRGGSWYNYARYCRVSMRFYDHCHYRNNHNGFRLALPTVDSIELK